MFWHIPSQAYKRAAPRFLKGKCVGSMFNESVAAQEAEMCMMKLLEARPSVKVSKIADFLFFYFHPLFSIYLHILYFYT